MPKKNRVLKFQGEMTEQQFRDHIESILRVHQINLMFLDMESYVDLREHLATTLERAYISGQKDGIDKAKKIVGRKR